MRNWHWCAALFVANLALACTEGDLNRAREPSAAQPEADELDVSDPAGLSQGGETSEIGGQIEYCPERASEARDLRDPEVAALAAMAEGHHELTLAWRREFLMDTITGFQPSTSVSLDVTVLGARDVEFGAVTDSGESCEGGPELQLDLNVQIQTADGVLSGSFEHRVTAKAAIAPTSGRQLWTTWQPGGGIYPLENFSSSLDVGMGSDQEVRGRLWVRLVFDGSSVRGELTPVILSETEARSWPPVVGRFPDDGCAYIERPVLLDAVPVGFIQDTPRTVYDRIHSVLEARGPFPAHWETGETTEMTLRAGAPTHACQFSSLIYIHGSERIETADGNVDFEHPVIVRFTSGGTSAVVGGLSAAIPSDAFEPTTGIRGIDLEGMEYANVELGNGVTFYDSSVRGSIRVHKWPDLYRLETYPALDWCIGDCAFDSL